MYRCTVPRWRYRVVTCLFAFVAILSLGAVGSAFAELSSPVSEQTVISADLKLILAAVVTIATTVSYVVYNRSTVIALTRNQERLQNISDAHIGDTGIHQQSMSKELIESRLINIDQKVDFLGRRVTSVEKHLVDKIDTLHESIRGLYK
jgi:NurA-like 5'-3' nuclease